MSLHFLQLDSGILISDVLLCPNLRESYDRIAHFRFVHCEGFILLLTCIDAVHGVEDARIHTTRNPIPKNHGQVPEGCKILAQTLTCNPVAGLKGNEVLQDVLVTLNGLVEDLEGVGNEGRFLQIFLQRQMRFHEAEEVPLRGLAWLRVL